MRAQSSLVKRLTLMFMFAVIAVLVVAGVSFYMLSQHHFQMLDEQALAEKLGIHPAHPFTFSST
jgi:two-component system heavy metal sensor histidine kinase CusS